jgi:hypothetical protein
MFEHDWFDRVFRLRRCKCSNSSSTSRSFVRQYPAVKDYLFWFDTPGEHIAGIVVAAGASAIRADFAAADHRYAKRARPCR